MSRRALMPLLLTLALAVQGIVCASALGAIPAWTTYRHDAGRSGLDPDSTSPVTPSQAWRTPALDGEVYAQPLIYGAHVYVATENDTVYELDAATGGVVWSMHLATPEPSSAAPCGDIAPSIGITGTPVIDPAANRIYAVGAVSVSGAIHHELFALDLSSGQPVAGFPIGVDPPFPSGGTPVNQLQRPGLALDGGRVLIGYGGNDGDCNTYWGWVVSAPTDGSTALSSFQVDSGSHEGAIWGAGNAPAIDGAGNVFVATGNGESTTSDPMYGDAVVKLNAAASPLDFWAPTNWHSLDSSDLDLGSSMPTLLPGGFVFESGKDGNGYLLNGAALGHVSAPVATVSGFCSGGSFGGSVYDPSNSTIYVTCHGGLKALSFASGSIATKAGFAAPSGATGPPTIAGGLVWAANYSSGTLYGLDLSSGATRSQFSIPESGTQVNHFATPSAGGGRLFVGSGNQVTAYTIANAPPPTATATAIASSANPAPAGTAVTLTAAVSPAPDTGTVTFTDGGAPISGCAGIALSPATGGQAVCRTTFATPSTHVLAASYSGDAFYAASSSAALHEAVTRGVPGLSGLQVSPRRVSIAGLRVARRCVKPTRKSRHHKACRRPMRLRVTYSLSAAVTVTLTFKHSVPGRKVRAGCVKPTKKNRSHKRCRRLVALPGHITLHGRAGRNAFTFTGRLGAHRLGPGSYVLIAAPTANGETGKDAKVTFTIVG